MSCLPAYVINHGVTDCITEIVCMLVNWESCLCRSAMQ